MLDRFLPPAREVRTSAHDVEGPCEALEGTETLVDLNGARRVDGLVAPAERQVRPVEAEVRLRERVFGARRLCLGYRSLTPSDCLARTPLVLKHARIPVEQVRPLCCRGDALHALDQPKCLTHAAESLWVVPEPQPHNSLLLHEPRLLHGIAAPECARLPIRAGRVFVCGHAHSDVA